MWNSPDILSINSDIKKNDILFFLGIVSLNYVDLVNLQQSYNW